MLNVLVWGLLLLTCGLFLAAILVLVIKEGRVEINPVEAVVYKNLWTGRAYALLPGTHFVLPGIHKRLVNVTLKNEPSNPRITKVATADPAEIGVDYVIYDFRLPRIGDKNSDGSPLLRDEEDLKRTIVRVATTIDYQKRLDLTIARIAAALQLTFSGELLSEIRNDQTGLNKQEIRKIQDEVNAEIKASVTDEWGLIVNVRIENIDFGAKIQEAATERITAKPEGEAIKTKADAAGVPPLAIAIGEMVGDLATILKSSR